MPADPVSVAVALADKIDTLVGFWAIDEKPTGSKDPYALRRAALGVIRIALILASIDLRAAIAMLASMHIKRIAGRALSQTLKSRCAIRRQLFEESVSSPTA